MTNVRQLKIAVIVLVALNLATVSFFLLMAPPHPPKGGPKNEIIEKLHFDEAQIEQYEVLIDAHQQDIQTAEKEISIARNNLYTLLKSNATSDEITLAIDAIGTIQRKIETIHFNHFLALKKLCKSDQLDYFNDLTLELESLFRPVKMQP